MEDNNTQSPNLELTFEGCIPKKYQEIILAYTQYSDKLVLGGSLALNILGIMKSNWDDRMPDIDFSLTEEFKPGELDCIVNFFMLSSRNTSYGGENKDLLLFSKLIDIENHPNYVEYNVDFFNKDYINERDIINITYKLEDGNKFKLKLTHPSIIISYKALYAFDPRVYKNAKHFNDLSILFGNKDKTWFHTLRTIEHQESLVTYELV